MFKAASWGFLFPSLCEQTCVKPSLAPPIWQLIEKCCSTRYIYIASTFHFARIVS
ncbi:hypothetical protein POPTR_005G211050v4 [Populus trichocarpa]|uniref:Uncharacterized protein n=1 Tax=Populus trichocarpa TaxID=3694 RepID=A0ACC0T1D3_POPTR|nr:hypothetical protein POPTR_005G211050v4 [Populus trichocarpa]